MFFCAAGSSLTGSAPVAALLAGSEVVPSAGETVGEEEAPPETRFPITARL